MTKAQIIKYLTLELEQKIIFLKENLGSLKEARNNEDKCTVGDKYETGRAMTQMELEKEQLLLNKTEDLKMSLEKIDPNHISGKVEFGSLVESKSETFFISIPFGKVQIENETVFCISPISPLGKMLEGKTAGLKFIFQGREIEITSIQ